MWVSGVVAHKLIWIEEGGGKNCGSGGLREMRGKEVMWLCRVGVDGGEGIETVAMGSDGSLSESKKERDETEEENGGLTSGRGTGGKYRQVVASLASELGVLANGAMLAMAAIGGSAE